MTNAKSLIDRLMSHPRMQDLHHALQEGDSLVIEELWSSTKALITAIAQQASGKHVVILSGAQLEERTLFHNLEFFTDRPIVDFPAWETLPNEGVAPSPDIVGERYQVLKELIDADEPHFVLSNLQACLQKLIEPEQFLDLYQELAVGSSYGFDALIKKLEEMGYTRATVAADKGEFAIRGGIVDLFPVSSPEPFRIEFWDDDIESIRTYDPIGQKSIKKVDRIQITPALELEFINQAKSMGTLFDYIGDNVLVVFDDLLALEDRYAALAGICGKDSPTFASIEELMDQLQALQKIYLSQTVLDELTKVQILGKSSKNYYSASAPIIKVGFDMFSRKLEAGRWQAPFIPVRNALFEELPEGSEVTGDELLLALGRLNPSKTNLHIIYTTEAEESGFQKRLLDAQVNLPEKTEARFGYLTSGFALPDNEVFVLPMTEFTHRTKIRRQKLRSTYHTTPAEVYDLAPGDMVVHLNHGIGRYLGQEKRPDHNKVEREYLLVEYANSSKLYVPMNQAHLVSKYIGSNESLPKVHTIGSKVWSKTKERTYQAIVGYAKDLLEIYAKRELQGGMQYPEDGDDLIAFEEEFPFVETEDQLDAVRQIKSDMTSKNAMDRLVCGDVGYGKTEVAMRAAFKAVLDGGKQVAMLVPTTVLAMQHYDNFIERMRSFPVRIGVLSRFANTKERSETLKGIANGTIDILIGTHRIISGDVEFHNLGLVIIDEEHRFGVKAKEHLKRIKVGVDCITLSATPIPRTLYMSLIGARDMSVINTPPQDRMPIKTVITEPNNEVIKNALLRELTRDGQAFYIHNRVETLPDVMVHIKKLLPQARVDMVHGQMSSKEIDNAFHHFKNGQTDILVATSIVENGIDIPNANTMIIDNADHFGLADLYQLRGRVGRWNRRAYAYFLVRRLHRLPEISRKRLNALAESTGYGGGMKLAMRDLEIRGAGDILGTEQSGHVSAIGFHFYCKMLKRTVRSLQGKMPMGLMDTRMEFHYDAKLPENYVNESSIRMEIYQRLGEALTWEDVEEIWEELKDRFGPPPAPVLWLYHLTRVRVFAARLGFTLIKITPKIVSLEREIKGKAERHSFSLKEAKTAEELEESLLQLLNVFVENRK